MMQGVQSRFCFSQQLSFESIIADPPRRVGDEFLAQSGGHAARQRGQRRRAYFIKKTACRVSLEQRIYGGNGAQEIVISLGSLQCFRQTSPECVCLAVRSNQQTLY